jgi:hypothetical protein
MILCLEPLLNITFSNGSLKEPLLNGSTIFFGSDICSDIYFFAPTDFPSHRSLIPIQRSKNKNLKRKSHELPTHFHLFSYIKREMREKRERREKRDRRNKNRNLTISTSNGHNF